MIRQALLFTTVALIVAGFVLIWDSPPESFLRQANHQFEEKPNADSFMTNITSRRYSVAGNEKFSLNSPRIEFFEGDASITMVDPNFATRTSAGRPLALSAAHGTLNTTEDRLDLDGNVLAHIELEESAAELTTEQLTYLTESNVATTEAAFKLITPTSKTSGVGLRANLIEETFAIQSKVKVTYEPM